MRRFFPQLEGRAVTHAWGGPIDVSPTHLPVIRTVGERSFAGFGYTGQRRRALADGRPRARLDGARPPGRVHVAGDRRPAAGAASRPSPSASPAGSIIRRAILRKESAEEEDRVPGPITRMVSGIPERIGIHVGR